MKAHMVEVELSAPSTCGGAILGNASRTYRLVRVNDGKPERFGVAVYFGAGEQDFPNVTWFKREEVARRYMVGHVSQLIRDGWTPIQ